jgi:hypothetical protein
MGSYRVFASCTRRGKERSMIMRRPRYDSWSTSNVSLKNLEDGGVVVQIGPEGTTPLGEIEYTHFRCWQYARRAVTPSSPSPRRPARRASPRSRASRRARRRVAESPDTPQSGLHVHTLISTVAHVHAAQDAPPGTAHTVTRPPGAALRIARASAGVHIGSDAGGTSRSGSAVWPAPDFGL